MNYYIDFDNTLYDTKQLTQMILLNIASVISNNTGENLIELVEKIKQRFNSGKDNFYFFSEELANEYNIEKKIFAESIRNTLQNGRILVYPDSILFLERLKEFGHKIILFTYLPKTNQEYQLQKINGSGLAKYFDTMIFTTESKHTLDIDYKNGIFIDDNTEVLEGLSTKNPFKLIRVRRKGNKYSEIDVEIQNMEEYEYLGFIPIDFNK